MAVRFWAKVEKTDTCWLWTGARSGDYGSFHLDGRAVQAHRVAWYVVKGFLPEVVDHVCRVTLCVRPHPKHTEDVTNRINVLRGVGVSARNAKKTHCPRGHPYDEENTYYRPDKYGRMCRRCGRERKRRRQAGDVA